MAIVCIALGSNLGDRDFALAAAIDRLRAEPGLRVLRASAAYETAPVGCPPDAAPFLNAAVVAETGLEPEAVLALLHRIEHQLGRVRTGHNSPRTIDLDLLLYDDQVMAAAELVVPHPRMHERAFVLVPLAEVAPGAFHPVLQKTVAELLTACPAAERSAVVAHPGSKGAAVVLDGQRALVTGSSSGIGRAVAVGIAAAGASVVVHGRSAAGIEATVEQCRPVARPGTVSALRADLAEPQEVDRLAAEAWEQSGGLEILACVAGADVLTGPSAKLSFEAKLEALLAVDLTATMRLARALGARMKDRGRGCILTIGWDQAETGMEGDSGQLFAAVKGAVMCFTRSLAKSLAPEVRVNCLAPGWIRTAWGDAASDAWQERVRAETPLGIWGLPEDVAAAAVWIASPAARFITGQTVRVNGGAIM